MKQSRTVFILAICCLLSSSITFADILATGDVVPSNPDTWTLSTDVTIGHSATGSLSVDDGSEIFSNTVNLGVSADVFGSAFISGNETSWTTAGWLNVADYGIGTMDITNGASVITQGDGYIGFYSGSSGTVTVDSSGSRLIPSSWKTSGWLVSGLYGNGTLNIQNGGDVSCSSLAVANQAGSTSAVNVNGAGSTLSINGDSAVLTVGHFGTGELNIANSGVVINGRGEVGCGSSGIGTVTVSGVGSMWTNTDNLLVGSEGQGVVNIMIDGTVRTGGLDIALGSSVNLNGGTLELTNTMDFNNWSGAFNFTHGEIKITHGTVTDQRSETVLSDNQNLTVTGEQSCWETGTIKIGYGGNSMLNVSDGGSVNSTNLLWIGGYFGWVYDDNSGTYTKNIINGDGFVNIVDGGKVSSGSIYIGNSQISSGVVTVDGAGSTLNSEGNLCLGSPEGGNGTLNVTNGGYVEAENVVVDGSCSYIHFNNGTLNAKTLSAGIDELTGTGTINTLGLISDIDLMFDAHNGLQQTLTLNNMPGQNIIIHLDLSQEQENGRLGVGKSVQGTMIIRDGITVSSEMGYIGLDANATGVVTVDGIDSTWSIDNGLGQLLVGIDGNGTLNIINGGKVNNGYSWLGSSANSSGAVTINGPGSLLSSEYQLSIGGSGNGMLNIINGGSVNSHFVDIGSGQTSTGVVAVDGGTITANEMTVGVKGKGTFLHVNGTTSITNKLTLAHQEGSEGDYTISEGQLTSGSIAIGSGGSGQFTQDGGSVTSNEMYIGANAYSEDEPAATGTGTYTLNDGNLEIIDSNVFIGGMWGSGTGHFIQNGGMHTNQGITISLGDYKMYDGTLAIEGYGSLSVGLGGSGMFVQNGGTVNLPMIVDEPGMKSVIIGQMGGEGIYNLAGGQLSTENIYLGLTSDMNGETPETYGTFVIGGGNVSTAGLYIAYSVPCEWGEASPEEVAAASHGNLQITDASSHITISEKLYIGPNGILNTIAAGSTIHMTGSAFENESTNPENLTGLANLTLIFEGGSEDIDPFEVAGEDMGAVLEGFDLNFALGTLQIGGDDVGQLQLVDTFDNRPAWEGFEALYVENLILCEGSSLDLNGFNLYYKNLTDLGGTIQLNGGSLIQVPEPYSLALLATGSLAILCRRRKGVE